MVVSIAVHRQNMKIIRDCACKHPAGMGYGLHLDFDNHRFTLRVDHDYYVFVAVDFLENYHHTALYSNLFYYPFSEQDNERLREVICANVRRIDLTGFACLPNIFPYDENEMIEGLRERFQGTVDD